MARLWIWVYSCLHQCCWCNNYFGSSTCFTIIPMGLLCPKYSYHDNNYWIETFFCLFIPCFAKLRLFNTSNVVSYKFSTWYLYKSCPQRRSSNFRRRAPIAQRRSLIAIHLLKTFTSPRTWENIDDEAREVNVWHRSQVNGGSVSLGVRGLHEEFWNRLVMYLFQSIVFLRYGYCQIGNQHSDLEKRQTKTIVVSKLA